MVEGRYDVIMDEHSPVQVLGLKVKPDVIPMGGHDLMHGRHFVTYSSKKCEIKNGVYFTEISWEGKGQHPSFQHGHFSLKVLILARIILYSSY
jgi:hypothetical protein